METIVDIDSLSYGRACVARADGKVLFVEGAAPGERARVRVTQDHGTYAEAQVIEILSGGSARVTPPCPIVGACGGCPWQHISYNEQLAGKHRALVDALERVGGIRAPPVERVLPSPEVFGYRNRLNLRFEKGRLGFTGAHSHRFTPAPDCLLAEQPIRNAIPEVETFVSSLSTRVARVEIAGRGLLPGLTLGIRSSGRLRRADTRRVHDYLSRPHNPIRGICMRGRGWKRAWGDTRRRFGLGTERVTVEMADGGFGQVNTAANAFLVGTVLQFAALRGPETVFDLYAGAGNLTLPLATRCHRVVGVEQDPAAAESVRRACEFHRITNVEFHAQRVEAFLVSPRASHPDCVVVNPPRAGLGRAVAALAELRAARIVYVSCDPTTLARDLRSLNADGYRLIKALPLDLFPHTYHVESVCDLELT